MILPSWIDKDSILITDMSPYVDRAGDKWRVVQYDAEGSGNDTLSGFTASSMAGGEDELEVDLEQKGWHAVYLGVGPSWKVLTRTQFRIKLSGDPCFTTITVPGQPDKRGLYLKEFLWKAADLTDRKIIIRAVRDTNIAYIRLVPLSVEQVKRIDTEKNRKDVKRLIAIKDSRVYHEAGERADLFETVENLKDTDFRALCLMVSRADFCEYPTEVGHYRTKTKAAMDRVIPGKVPFQLIMEYCHRVGLEFHAYIRTAFRTPYEEVSGERLPTPGYGLAGDRPDLCCRGKDGAPLVHLSYAYLEVRERMVAIVREVAEYGVDGVNLAMTRGPIYVMFEESAVRDFKDMYGVDPRQLDEKDERWLRHRAGYMTAFLRDARKAVNEAAAKLGKSMRLSVLLYYSEQENLLHGLDARTWVEEGLVDDLMPQTKIHYFSPIHDVDMEFYGDLVKGKNIGLFPGPWINANGRDRGFHGDNDNIVERAQAWYGQGADGLSFRDITDGVQEICMDMSGALDCEYRPLWPVLGRLGHREELNRLKETDFVRYRRLISLDGWNVSHSFSETDIELIVQQGGG